MLLRVLFIAVLLHVAAWAATPCPKYSCAAPQWTVERIVTLNNTASSSALVNFPVLVTLTPEAVNYSDIRSGGADIRFYTSSCLALSYEFDVSGAVRGVCARGMFKPLSFSVWSRHLLKMATPPCG